MITPGFYNLVTLENGDETSWGRAEIMEVEGNLIKVRRGNQIQILNTAASTFISATPVKAPSTENAFAEFSVLPSGE